MAAATHFDKFKVQPTNITMRSYLNRLQIALAAYHSVKYTADEREGVNYPCEKGKGKGASNNDANKNKEGAIKPVISKHPD